MILTNPRARFWLTTLGIFCLLVWALEPMLLPFVAGLTIAYFLNPAVNIVTRLLKFPRWLATLTVLAGFVLFVVQITLLIVPVLQAQTGTLIHAMPGYIESVRHNLLPWAQHWLGQLPTDDADKIREATGDYASSVVGWTGKLVQRLVTGGAAIFSMITLMVITPVVAFYLLRDWPKLMKSIDILIPRKHYKVICEQLHEIDKTLSGFIRGQALVCLSLAIIYGGGLTLVGLKYGATIGIVAGLLSFIPYCGSTFVLVTSMLLALVQFDTLSDILMVLSVFLVGQTLEGYFLTPKLVGDRVGLHPVWILFALFAGGTLIGFLGVLIAVPVAAVVGVLVRFVLKQYRSSTIYKKPLPASTTQTTTKKN